ncbi:MAG TPA: class I SAM-dependent methyltransferase, partial [Lacibacter sp.]|nr:class I SAM-dependent methyltransferase [Lacibacter sp.]
LTVNMARVHAQQPRRILELGTSLGITTAYLAKGAPGAEVVSLEGAPAVAKLAAANLAALQSDNTAIVSGNFDSTLAQVLAANALPFDFVFVDGNHRYEPSVRYFRQLAEQAGPDTVLVFDDIHWSREMEEAWNEICSASGVRLTIDLFFIGLVFFRTEQLEREHFRIRF